MVLDTLTGDNVIDFSQLKEQFADEVDTKGLKNFFSEEAWLSVAEKGV